MKKLFLSLISSVVLVSSLVSVPAYAETATGTDLQAKINLVSSLNAQIKALQDQVSALIKEIQAKQQEQGANIIDLLRTLRQGSQGDDVRILQAILAADSSIYPEGIISGYFGPATFRAVIKFQLKNGFEGVGNVGPKTLGKLKEELGKIPLALVKDANGMHVCAIIPPGHLIAPGWLRKQGGVLPIVPECQVLPAGIKIKIEEGFPADKTAPVISSIGISNIIATGAKVNWTTNEFSTSKVYYSTTSPVNINTAFTSSGDGKVLNHTVNLTGLTANTLYYLIVESKDASGNVATSSVQQFTTPSVDTAGPIIGSVASGNVTASSAGISWTTNENSTSKVYYSTTNPVNLATALNVSSDALLTSHLLSITGLNSGTTYYYVVESKDASGNVSTSSSSEQKFTTATVDTVAPIISSVVASSTTTTSSAIIWNTNEPSTSKVYYSTTSPVNTASALTISDVALVSNHSLNLTGLNPGTTYYYVVESKDGSNNTAQSPDQMFSTLADTAAPVISGVSVSSLTSSNATINWTTDEAATSKVYYSTSTPLDIASSTSVSGTGNVTNHSLNLTGLSATTTYYFVIESKDTFNNTSTTTEQHFVTL